MVLIPIDFYTLITTNLKKVYYYLFNVYSKLVFIKIKWEVQVFSTNTLREKCPYLEFFWSILSHIQNEYGPGKFRIRTLFTQSLAFYAQLNPIVLQKY